MTGVANDAVSAYIDWEPENTLSFWGCTVFIFYEVFEAFVGPFAMAFLFLCN